MKLRIALVLAGLCFGGPVLAAEGTAAAAFGAREYVQQISLSPDGKQVALVAPSGVRGAKLLVIDIAAGTSKTILVSSGEPERLSGCRWSTETRLVCKIYAIIKSAENNVQYTRVLALNNDGSDMKMMTEAGNNRSIGVAQDGGSVIDWSADASASAILMTRNYLPEMTTNTRTASEDDGLGVERVDTVTLARRSVEKPYPNAVEYISDGRGSVRILGLRPTRGTSGYAGARTAYLYRQEGKREWLPLSQVVSGPTGYTGFNPYAVDPKLNVAYGFNEKDGRQALFKVSLDGSLTQDLVLARPDVDVAGLVRIGRQDRVVGAYFVTDRRETEFFDPELRKLGAALGRALAGRIVTFIDASADESKLLLFAGGDSDPGVYYIFDKSTRKLQDLTGARPQLEGLKLATVKAVTYPAADGAQIPAYLTLPAGSDGRNLPAIVMPHGGPSARDEWGFDWLAQFFAHQGYAVLQPNYRGSSGYGADWFQKNGFQSWRTAIGDVNDGGRWLQKEGIAAPGKLAIVGWSYGGYAALQSAVLDSDLFKAVVAIAPVTDLEMLRNEFLNFENYLQASAFIGRGPHVTEGSPAQNAAAIKAPVLLFHGDLDANVGIGESRLMERKLKAAGRSVELIEFKGLDHQLADDAARTQMLGKADAFLRTALGF